MCGIAGIVDLRGTSDVPESLLRRMTDALTHRGPDESGLYLEPGVGFGHRRLSIIDLCQRRSKISPPGRSKTSPLNVMRYAVLGGSCGPTGSTLSSVVKQAYLGISAVFGFG